jgi:hypothetical protein
VRTSARSPLPGVRHGVTLNDAAKRQRQQGLQHIHPHYSGYTPLHPHIDGDDGRGVLTEAAGGEAATLDIDTDKWL